MATTATDADGLYTFTGLHGGDYLVQVDASSVVTTSFGVTSTLATAMDLVSGTNPHDVSLSNGQAYTTADFGYNWGGSIGDYVWWDNNVNRLQDEDPATPIANAAVLLYYDANDNGILDLVGQPGGDTDFGFAMTNASGLYLFDNLPPGRFLVDVYEDSITTDGARNVVPTTSNVVFVNLGPNQDVLTADFGYFVGALVEGNVFWDENHNGVLDSGEQNPAHLLNNVTVNIVCLGPDGAAGGGDDYSGSMDSGTQTLPNGHFSFIVPPGPCTLTYDQADIPAQYGDRTTPTTYTFTAIAGEDWHPSFDFGVDNSGSIGDTIYVDDNRNGVQDPEEPGLEGVTVYLYNSSGTVLFGVTATGVQGKYLFESLADGAYDVVVNEATLPENYVQIADPDFPGQDCNLIFSCDSRSLVNISNGGSDLDRDFGYKFLPPILVSTYTIRGSVWEDKDGDGVYERNGNDGLSNTADDERPIANVRVTVDCTGVITQTFTVTTTQSILGGNWAVSAIPEGATCTIDADESTLPGSSYVATTPATLTVSNIQADVLNQNFGYQRQLGTVSGTVCAGSGATPGQCETGQDPLSTVTVTLVYAGADGFLGTSDDVTQTTTTDANGVYTFTGLLAGNYQVLETNPPGYISLADRDGFNPDNISFTLMPGVVLTGQDFEDAPPPDLAVSKVLSAPVGGTATVSDTITFTIRITNTGLTALTALTVTDTYDPAALRLTSHSVAPDAQASGFITWTTSLTPSLPLSPGQALTLTIDFYAEAPTSSGVTTNTVTVVATDVFSRTTLPQQDSANVAIRAAADLAIAKADDPDPVMAGEALTYTLLYTNSGPSPAQAVFITDTLPAGVTFGGVVSETPAISGPVVAGQTLTWNLPTLAANASGSIVFIASVGSSVQGVITNTAAVTSTTYDPTPENNTDQEPTLAQATAVVGDLVWWDVDGDGRQDAGEPGIPGVDVVLSNGVVMTTTTDASGVYTFSSLPAGAHILTIPAYEFGPGGTLASWNASPQNALGVPDDLDSDADPLTHQATVTLNPAQMDQSVDFGFTYAANYAISKRLHTPDPVRIGDPVSFTVRITNTGSAAITSLPLTDQYNNTFLTYGYMGSHAAPASVDAIDDGQIVWADVTQGAGLGSGLSVTVVFTFTAREDSTSLPNGEAINTAIVSRAYADPDGAGPIPPARLPQRSDSDGVRIMRATGLGVVGFRAASEGEGVRLTWRTLSETRIAGFNVLRAASTGGMLPAADAYQAVNGSAILATQAGSDQGASYSYRDEATTPGVVYHYRLEILRTDGGTEVYGDAEATVATRRLYAPLIIR